MNTDRASTSCMAGSTTSGRRCPEGGRSFDWVECAACLRRLQDPQDAFRIIHVTGTKGKGSTCALLAGAITASGTRTGLFCSPHLHRLEERFQIDGREISPAELVELTESIRPVVIDCDATETASGARELTFFEVTTAMGLLHFARRNAGVVVLEVGMGGRLDSTNVVRPALSIINSVSFDHTRQLGRTLGTIAYEKAGIIKHRTPCLTGVTDPEPLDVIRRVAGQRESRLYELGPHFGFEYAPPVAPISLPRAGSVQVRSWRSHWGPSNSRCSGPIRPITRPWPSRPLTSSRTRGLRFPPRGWLRASRTFGSRPGWSSWEHHPG